MIDVRVGISFDKEINDRMSEICEQHGVSKSAFLTSMVMFSSEEEIANKIHQFKNQRDLKRTVSAQLRREIDKKMKGASPEEMQRILAAFEQARAGQANA